MQLVVQGRKGKLYALAQNSFSIYVLATRNYRLCRVLIILCT